MKNTTEKWNKFKYWWTNVFWYHYRLRALVIIFIVVLAVGLVVSVVSNVPPDFTIAITTRQMIFAEQMAEVERVIAEHAGDRNGDGKIGASVQVMNFIGGENEYASQVKMTVLMTDQEFVLMILDRETMNQYITTEAALEPLKNLGLKADDPAGYGVRVDQWPIFHRAYLDDYAADNETEYYFCFKTLDGKEYTGAVKERYEYAVSLVEFLRDYP